MYSCFRRLECEMRYGICTALSYQEVNDMYAVMYVAGFISAFLFLYLYAIIQARRKAKGKSGSKKRVRRKKVRIDTYVKAATSLVLGHGLVMVTMSYVLAWYEKDAVVDVSTTLITEIVAPLCLYMGTNCIMNIFEKNELSFSKPMQVSGSGRRSANKHGWH